MILVAGGFVEGYSVLFNQSALRLYPRWGRAGELLNNVLYGNAPPRDLTPHTFIVEGARRVCLGLEPPHKKFNVTQFFAQSI